MIIRKSDTFQVFAYTVVVSSCLQMLPLCKNPLNLYWLLDTASALSDFHINPSSSSTWLFKEIAQGKEKRQQNMMISKLITILGTITFSFLIAANDMLTIAILICELLRSNCAYLESLG